MRCYVRDCFRPARARGLCQTHYLRTRKNKIRPHYCLERKLCWIKSCKEKKSVHHLCNKHHKRVSHLLKKVKVKKVEVSCWMPNCESTNQRHGGHGLCGNHYSQVEYWFLGGKEGYQAACFRNEELKKLPVEELLKMVREE